VQTNKPYYDNSQNHPDIRKGRLIGHLRMFLYPDEKVLLHYY